MKNSTISRRKFLGTTAAAAAGISVVPLNYSCTSGTKKPNSKVNGVQLGLTTYSYRTVSHGLEEVLEHRVGHRVSLFGPVEKDPRDCALIGVLKVLIRFCRLHGSVPSEWRS